DALVPARDQRADPDVDREQDDHEPDEARPERTEARRLLGRHPAAVGGGLHAPALRVLLVALAVGERRARARRPFLARLAVFPAGWLFRHSQRSIGRTRWRSKMPRWKRRLHGLTGGPRGGTDLYKMFTPISSREA